MSTNLVFPNKRMFSAITDVPLDKIDLDLENPRLAHVKNTLTLENIEEYIFDEEDGRRLYKQLIQDEEINEEVWLQKIGDRYKVREGNRRVTASKRFVHDIEAGKLEGFNADNYRMIPSKIFKDDIREKDIDMFLGTLHITGKKDWSASNKGHHIFKMITEYNEGAEAVAEQLGMTESGVNKAFHAYKLTQEYGKKYGGNFIHYYTYFDEVLKSPTLRKCKDDDPKFIVWLMELIHENKITDHRQVRNLREILEADPQIRNRALKVLDSKNGRFVEAYEIYQLYCGKGFWNVIKRAVKMTDTVSLEQLKIAAHDSEKRELLKKLSVSIKNMEKAMNDLGDDVDER